MLELKFRQTVKRCKGVAMKYLILAISGIFFLGSFSQKLCADVKINEFMSYNVSTYPDMCDYDNFSDWIELYNDADEAISLSGYYLSDNLNKPTKWAFPADAAIPAKGFLIVWADDYNDKPGTVGTRDYYPFDVSFTTKRYHTNFKLSDLGDEIGLFKTSGIAVVPVDTVSFSRQLPDVSMGKDPVSSEWYNYDSPTPGAANTTTGKPLSLITYSPSVNASVSGGYYTATQMVALTTSSGTSDNIYYTTNGNNPTTNSIKYTAPIDIGSTTTLRARCINPSNLAGSILTATYFINETAKTMMTVSIVADSSFLWGDTVGMYKNSFKGMEIPASIEFFNPDGKAAVQVMAGISPGSLTSYTSPQKPLQVSLKGKYGSDFITYQLFSKPAACYPKIRFRNAGDAWGTTLMADGLVESICKGQMSNTASAYRPVIIYINGKYWGIQEMREQFDGQFFTNNFGLDPTSLNDVRTTILPPYPGAEGWECTAGTWDEYSALMTLAKTGSMTDATVYNQISEKMDINSFIDYICAEDFGANISWGHNIELWKVNGTKFRWLLCDFDRAFVYGKVALNLFSNGGGGISGSIMPKDTLFTKLINNTQFKNHFVQRFAAHLNSTFSSKRMNYIVDSISNILKPEMPGQVDRWKADGGIQSMEAWQLEVADMKNFMTERPANVFNHVKSQFNLSGIAKLAVAADGSKGDIYINGVKMCSGTDSLIFFKNIPFTVRAVPKSGYVFAGWDGITANDSLSVTMSSDTTLTAKFVLSERHILPLTISSNTILSLTDQPYVISGDLTVTDSATLTIEKGVTIALGQDAGIYVKGRMLVIGTESQPVTFKADEFSGATKWSAICFDTSEDTNRISYAVINGATLGRDALNHKAGINGNQTILLMDHITMSNVIYPLYFEGGSTVFRDSKVTIEHMCNGGIHIGRGGALVENNFFVSTGVTMNTDAIDIKGVIDGIIRNNRLYNFNGSNSDGIDLGESAKNILVTGNYIFGNRDKGISVGGQSTAIITNNIVVDCDMGIGVKDAGSSAELDHNTFIRNNHAVECYEKAYPRGGGSLVVKNSILAHSRISTYVVDTVSTVTFSYCISDMDSLPGVGNILGNPMFISLVHNNFQLANGSPCINAGDPAGAPDGDGSRTDIGAQYTYNADDFPPELAPIYSPTVVINEVMYKDNADIGSKDWIELYNAGKDDVDISNWRLTDLDVVRPIAPMAVPALPVTDDAEPVLDSSHIFFIPPQTTLAAGAYLVILKSSSDFSKAYKDVNNYCKTMLNLSFDEDERLALYDCDGNLVNAFRYGNKAPWPTAPDGNGSSLELINPGDYNFVVSNWNASKITGGTPGKINSVFDNSSPVIRKTTVANNKFYVQNYPNPFKKSTIFKFYLPDNDHVAINLFSLSGKKLETIIDTDMKSGSHQIKWSPKLAAGIYLYKIQTSCFSKVGEMNIR
jgi:parallel beta-helix repeat protein